MLTTTTPKHERIFRDLRGQILRGDLRSGQSLPTQNELMERYGSALGTVRQAIDRLQSEGLVWAKRGKGTFVADTDTATVQRRTTVGLTIFSRYESNPIADDILVVLQKTLQESGYDLVFRLFGTDEADQAEAWTQGLAGVLTWSLAPTAFINALIQRGQPVIVLGEGADRRCPDGASHIGFDISAVMNMAVQFLANQGHRQLLSITQYPDLHSPYLDQLSETLATAVDRFMPDGEVEEVTVAETGPMTAVLERLSSGEKRPTALLIENSHRAINIVRAVERLGLRVPEDVSVVALTACISSLRLDPDLSRIETPIPSLAAKGAEALLEAIATGRVVRQLLSPELIWGTTCRPLDTHPNRPADADRPKATSPSDSEGE